MSSFRDLQTIYEGGYRGQAIQFPELTSGVKSPTEDKHSYKRPLPGQTPGKQQHVMSTIPLHSSDEEGQVDKSTFMRQDIIKKINELIQDADKYGDTKTIFALSDLKTYIERL